MRVFLPSTLPALANALRTGHVAPGQDSGQGPGEDSGHESGPMPGYAVTPVLREAYASGDEEELEYAALAEAARASLRLLAADEAAPRRRVVLAAEVPADRVKSDTKDEEPARVLIGDAIPLDRLACAYVDDPAAGDDVRDAVQALAAADAGDEDARFAVDGAEGHELGWYATQELRYLV